ncbi:MAG: lipopolysaccharide assembly protein LapA domain-containing protein [Deltaproteobacteria bacterium]
MKNPKVIAGLVIGVLFLIFLFQNMEDVPLEFYFWQVSMPKIVLVPLAILVGFVGGFVLAKIKRSPRKPQSPKDAQAPAPSGPSTPGPKN